MRIGILGTARITRMALLAPARAMENVEVAAIASRDIQRARRYAAKRGIPRILPDYAALVADPDLDIIYNPLPSSLHGLWSIRALEAGKHVLCEKPFAANASEAAEMKAVAERSGKILMEAFHYRFHPMMQRILELVHSGQLGRLQTIEAKFRFFWPGRKDFRYQLETAGGVTMDLGCYLIHAARCLTGEEPTVTRAHLTLLKPELDSGGEVELLFPSGTVARLSYSLRAHIWNWRSRIALTGETGTLLAVNPFLPQYFHRLKWTAEGRTRKERFPKTSTYQYQLAAFLDAVRTGSPPGIPLADSLANMKVIDAIYQHAGLSLRSP